MDQTCPRCGSQVNQVRAGINNGRQQYQCSSCGRRYVALRAERGYPPNVKQQAVALRNEGHTVKAIENLLGVNARTLQNWFRIATDHATLGPPSADTPIEPLTDGPDANPQAAPKRRVTIQHVADSAGVAVSTVSNYLNGKGRMGAATRSRIKEAVDSLRFTPSGLTRAIRQGRTGILGVQTFGLWDLDEGVGYSIVPPILTGINRTADQLGRDILLHTSRFNSENYGGTRYLDGHIDGLIWVAPAIEEPVLDYTADAGLPVVALLTRHVPDGVGYINADNAGGMRAAVEHLVSLGRQRIGYYGPLYTSNYMDRYDGFRSAMADAGLTFDTSPMKLGLLPGKEWEPSKFEQGVRTLVGMADKLDGMIFASDGSAAVAIHLLSQAGIRVPDDIAVIGFDDVPEASRTAGGITSVRQPFRQMGQLAVERLLALIDGAPITDCRIVLPTKLVVRGSTVPMPVEE